MWKKKLDFLDYYFYCFFWDDIYLDFIFINQGLLI